MARTVAKRSPRRPSCRPVPPVLATAPHSLLRDLGEIAFGLAGAGCAAWVFLAYLGVV